VADTAGDATEPREPGDVGSGTSLPAPRHAPGERRPTDEELLRRHIAGDHEAFGELFLRHKDRLWAVAVRTLSDPQDAGDALQEAMISAFRRAGSFRGDSAVTTWLHRIVVNACLDRMRRKTARPEIPGGDERVLDTLAAHPGCDPTASTDLSLEVVAALRQLPRDQQVALVLVDMLGYPVADAAAMLSVAEGTVKSRCARARARLLPRLAHLRQRAGDPAADGRNGPGIGGHVAGAGGEPSAEVGNRFAAGTVLPGREGGEQSQ
jgi:RNA polymerase sigma-70 factor, ECF subfamily